MNKPNYKNGSIVNLMASIKIALGGRPDYQPLKSLNLAASKNIVLIIIDGMGHDYITKHGQNSFMLKNLKAKLTSVFPSTTAAAMTSFSTGQAPAQHALTGWFMYLKEVGAVIKTLPFRTRAGDFKLEQGKIKYSDIYSGTSFFKNLKASSIVINHKDYIDSEYNRLIYRGARRLPFSNFNDFFRQINRALRLKGKRKFIFAYWPEIDALCHRQGTDSRAVKKHFIELDKKIK